MKYEIRINEEDYMKFNVFYQKYSKMGKRQTNTMRILFPFIALLFFMIFVIAGAKTRLIITEAIGLTIASVIWCIFTPNIMEINVRRNINMIKANGKLPYHPYAEVELQDSMIVEKSEQGEIHVNYKDIETIYSDEDYLYVFYSATQALIFPYTCLGDDKERIVEYITKKSN